MRRYIIVRLSCFSRGIACPKAWAQGWAFLVPDGPDGHGQLDTFCSRLRLASPPCYQTANGFENQTQVRNTKPAPAYRRLDRPRTLSPYPDEDSEPMPAAQRSQLTASGLAAPRGLTVTGLAGLDTRGRKEGAEAQP